MKNGAASGIIAPSVTGRQNNACRQAAGVVVVITQFHSWFLHIDTTSNVQLSFVQLVLSYVYSCFSRDHTAGSLSCTAPFIDSIAAVQLLAHYGYVGVLFLCSDDISDHTAHQQSATNLEGLQC